MKIQIIILNALLFLSILTFRHGTKISNHQVYMHILWYTWEQKKAPENKKNKMKKRTKIYISKGCVCFLNRCTTYNQLSYLLLPSLLFFKIHFRCEKMWLNKKQLTKAFGLNFHLKKEPEKLVYAFALYK